jgi:peptidoglycan/xylan/chitin deacetylase (PgdA/CDA1 family)
MRLRDMLAAAILACLPATGYAQQIALTFDDLPAHSALPPGESRVSVAKAILAALKDAETPPVYGFVNGARVAEDPSLGEVLSLWRSAGYPLGNHTWSHPNLRDLSAGDFDADILRNEPLLETLGGDWRWLRYPFLSEGETAEKRTHVRAFLAGRGYRVAAVSLSFDDYAWNEPYARCQAMGDAAAVATLEARYLSAAAASLDYARAMSQTLYGRDIPYVLLMHVGAFDARMLPRLLAFYRGRGVAFITLERAERDPFYRQDVRIEPHAPDGTLEAAMAARGLPVPQKAWAIADLQQLCR